MSDLVNQSQNNPEFARVLDVARLRNAGTYSFEISPTEQERAAIAKLMGATSVKKLVFSGKLVPLDSRGWQLHARLGASVVQQCVVTLDPVLTRVDQEFDRKFLPADKHAAADIVVTPDDDEVEPLEDTIDLGLVAIESLALALPAYPRKTGAELATSSFAPSGVAPLQDEDLKPFAALAALKDKLGNDR